MHKLALRATLFLLILLFEKQVESLLSRELKKKLTNSHIIYRFFLKENLLLRGYVVKFCPG